MGLLICSNKDIRHHTVIYLSQAQSVGKIINEVKKE